ncbi:MAG: MFS transporter [Candidatus Izemoplasmatales bacterium]|nr:MFS transporter [Candidatus Izemoplasmatales bacterium]
MKLWNRNFSIVTIGSFISAFGSAAAGIAFGILIYKETGSPLTLALFTIANIIPRVVTNFIVGPFVDRHSRKKIIVTIDFFCAFLFAIISIILFQGYFNVLVFTIVAAGFGVIDTLYQVAFMSLFPEVISPGLHSKAYSISSLIWPISAAVMAPVAAYFIENFVHGVALLMVFNAVTFFITASIELLINAEEKLNQQIVKGPQFIQDLREAVVYYKKERGILGIGILFAAFSFVYAAADLLRMPYFVQSATYNLQHFSFLVSASAVGRVVGGIIHYLFKYPTNKKYLIAVSVYITVEVMSATMLYLPVYALMVVSSFIVGLLSVTSFNIRMSATQTYIPGPIRGRVNATQQLLWNFGAIVGTLIIGLMAEYSGMDYRLIILLAATVSMSAIFLIPVRMKDEFKRIYNVDV